MRKNWFEEEKADELWRNRKSVEIIKIYRLALQVD